MSAFGGARGVGAKPPEKGIFPLDHFGECKKVPPSDQPSIHPCAAPTSAATATKLTLQAWLLQVADAYLACLKVHDKNVGECQTLAKRYLECRMER